MKKILLALLVVLLAYLLAWPVPVDPVAWQPPPPPALEGPYAPNTFLAGAERLDLPDGHGPEDVALDSLGRIYAGLQDGRIIRMQPEGDRVETFAQTGGRPLGLRFDPHGTLLVADAYQGLLAVTPDGAVATLAREADGVPFGFTNNLDLAADGTVYFTDASSRFGQADYRLDLIESRPNGRLLAYDPATGATRVLLDSLYFANGVALSPDGAFLLVCETARYRLRRYWLQGPRQGTDEVFLDNLPGFPDNLASNGRGMFWLALASPRNRLLDALAPYPFLRKIVIRLPDLLQPAPQRYAFALGLDADGRVVHNLQNPAGEPFAVVTSVRQVGAVLYLGSLEEPALARIAAPR